MIKVDDLDYFLPSHLIAQLPAPKREESRLMVLDRRDGKIEHRYFSDIIEYLEPGDSIVVNNTKVIPARIYGRKETGGKVEILLISPLDEGRRPIPPIFNGRGKDPLLWECIIRNSKGMRAGAKIEFSGGMYGIVNPAGKDGRYLIQFLNGNEILKVLEEIGETPLPPYIKRRSGENRESFHRKRYQTIFARRSGSIAAPTAGLHFSFRLLKAIRKKGVEIHAITLQVGIGTFLPIKVEEVTEHLMEKEYREVSPRVASSLNRLREKGGKICAVGTTTIRALESSTDNSGRIIGGKGFTDLFIHPGYSFKAVDMILTNFHLPRSTPLALVCAFAGIENIKKAYGEAIKMGYRFYSYGDAMLII
jgi:S-adenosylmethionine:tRNA ribosyltransferase-isomerase